MKLKVEIEGKLQGDTHDIEVRLDSNSDMITFTVKEWKLEVAQTDLQHVIEIMENNS